MRGSVVKFNGRTIGVIEGRTFIMKRKASLHMLRKPRPAWALSEAVFFADVLPSCDLIRVLDEDGGQTYQTTAKTFERHHRLIERPPFEPQVCLTLDYWTVSNGGVQPVEQSRHGAKQIGFALLGI